MVSWCSCFCISLIPVDTGSSLSKVNSFFSLLSIYKFPPPLPHSQCDLFHFFCGIGSDQIGSDRIGLDWIGLDWIGLDWIGLDWIGLDWMGWGGAYCESGNCIT